MGQPSKEKRLLEAVKLAILGYEKETDMSVDSLVMHDDRGGTGDFHGTVIFTTEDKAHKSKTYAV